MVTELTMQVKIIWFTRMKKQRRSSFAIQEHLCDSRVPCDRSLGARMQPDAGAATRDTARSFERICDTMA